MSPSVYWCAIVVPEPIKDAKHNWDTIWVYVGMEGTIWLSALGSKKKNRTHSSAIRIDVFESGV